MTGPQDDTGDEDAAVWKRLTAGVKAYERDAPPGSARPSLPKPKPKRKPSATPSAPAVRLGQGLAPKNAPDPVDLRRGDHAGIDRSTRRRLAQGQLAMRTLDLHGMTAAQAERHLSRFINSRWATANAGPRDHRQGANNNGVLKRLVPMWLKSPPLGQGSGTFPGCPAMVATGALCDAAPTPAPA